MSSHIQGDVLRAVRAGMAVVVICAAMQAPAAPKPHHTAGPTTVRIDSAYYHGEIVNLQIAAPAAHARPVILGPWNFGERIAGKRPEDNRLNMYLVCPGRQYVSAIEPDYDLNVVLNEVPAEGVTREFDVFYAIILDPRLRDDLLSERDLLMAAQQRFTPEDLLEIEDIPGVPALRALLHIDSLEGLARFRDKNDDSLPRLILVPADFAVRAGAIAADATETAAK